MTVGDTSSRRRQYGLHSDAVVLHCPGELRDERHPMHAEWKQAVDEFFADDTTRGSFADDPDLTIITYNTEQGPSLLERCASHLGTSVVVLGRDLRDWRWEYKVTLPRDYLRAKRSSPYVMCVDAFDTLILASPADILRRYRRSSAAVLFGNTHTDYPPSEVHRRFEDEVARDAPPHHRHLNASFIGRYEDVLAGLDELAEAIGTGARWARTAERFDDQLAWRELHRRHYPRLRIDTHRTIFSRFDEHR